MVEYNLRDLNFKELFQQFVLLAIHTFEEFARVHDGEGLLPVVIGQCYHCCDDSRLAFAGWDADDRTRLSLVAQGSHRTSKLVIIRDEVDITKVVVDSLLELHVLMPLGFAEVDPHLLQLLVEFKLVLQEIFNGLLRILGLDRFYFASKIRVLLRFGFGSGSFLG